MDLKNILLLAVVQLLGLLVSAGFAEYAKKVMWVEEAVIEPLHYVDMTSFTLNETSFQYHKTFQWSWKEQGLILEFMEKINTNVTFKVMVTLNGHYAFPPNLNLASAIFRIESSIPINKPIKVSFHHSYQLDELSSGRLTFVRAENSNLEPKHFKPIPGGVFSNTKSYGSLVVTNFSYWAICSEGKSFEFLAFVFFRWETWEMMRCTYATTVFTITGKLPTCTEAMKHEFPEHEEVSRFTIMFSGEALELDLGRDGIKTANGWSIYPLFPPIIYKESATNFTAEYFPHIKLRIEWSGQHIPPVFSVKERIEMSGAEVYRNGKIKKRSSFVINSSECTLPDSITNGIITTIIAAVVLCSCLGGFSVKYVYTQNSLEEKYKHILSESRKSLLMGKEHNIMLPIANGNGCLNGTKQDRRKARVKALTEKPTMDIIRNFPGIRIHFDIVKRIGTDYLKLGDLLLQDETGEITSALQEQYRGNCSVITREVLRKWLEGKGKPVTWNTLIETLKSMDCNVLASDIVKGVQYHLH